jgi:hypothetical protein
MTRSRGDQIVVKPKNDVYTALAATGVVVLILGIIALFLQSNVVFGDNLFMPSGATPTNVR